MNEVLRKVGNLKKCCLDGEKRDYYDLKDVDGYLSEGKNPSIKKYKSVISEYYRKYTTELKPTPLDKPTILADAIKTYLKKINLSSLNADDDLTMLYWMVEYVVLPKEPKR